ncbi:MAG: HAD family phosphatase [Eubacterium sp.]|nr:HAD family phosphatase [Candidatus Colimonas fimequi]
MIKTVIFDIGRVLVEYDWVDYFGGLFDWNKKTMEAVRNAFFEHNIWKEVDRGRWSDEELMEAFISFEPDYEEEIKLAWAEIGTAIKESAHTKPWINDLKARGYQTLYLSNWSHHLLDVAAPAMTFVDIMDGGVFSCDVELIKPDPAIYHAIIDKYDLVPEECVFLDDKQENIEAALGVGMQGIVVKNHEQAAADLEALLKSE